MSDRKYDVDLKVKKQGSTIITEQSQDVDPSIRSAKAIKDATGGKTKEGMYHAARIPQIMLLKWGMEDAGDQLAYLQGKHNKDPDLAKKFAMRLNSSEFNAFRIWGGHVAASDITKEANKLAVKPEAT